MEGDGWRGIIMGGGPEGVAYTKRRSASNGRRRVGGGL